MKLNDLRDNEGMPALMAAKKKLKRPCGQRCGTRATSPFGTREQRSSSAANDGHVVRTQHQALRLAHFDVAAIAASRNRVLSAGDGGNDGLES